MYRLPDVAPRCRSRLLQVHLLLRHQNRVPMQPALHRHVIVPEHVIRHLQVRLRHQRRRAVVESGPVVVVAVGINLPIAACTETELEDHYLRLISTSNYLFTSEKDLD